MTRWEAGDGEVCSANELGAGFCQIHLKGKEDKGHFRNCTEHQKERRNEKFSSISSKKMTVSSLLCDEA